MHALHSFNAPNWRLTSVQKKRKRGLSRPTAAALRFSLAATAVSAAAATANATHAPQLPCAPGALTRFKPPAAALQRIVCSEALMHMSGSNRTLASWCGLLCLSLAAAVTCMFGPPGIICCRGCHDAECSSILADIQPTQAGFPMAAGLGCHCSPVSMQLLRLGPGSSIHVHHRLNAARCSQVRAV
jgi:hypothetical protein